MKGRLPLGLLLALTLAGPARADANLRFVLVAGADQELGRRLVAEARQAGFEVTLEPPSEQTPASALARRHHAVGVLRVASSASVELWLVGDGEQPPSSTNFQPGPAEGDAFAVRVVEETRARVVALHLPELAAAEPPAPPPAHADDAQARDRRPPARSPALERLAAGAGIGVTKATGLGPTLHAELHARARFTPRVGASLLTFLPLAANEFSAPEGTGRARVFLFGAGLDWLALSPAPALRIELDAVAGAAWLPLSADPHAGYVATTDHLLAGVMLAGPALDVGLSSWLGLRLNALGGTSLPRPVVRFDGREVAAWGRFVVCASAALELAVE